MVTLGNYKWDNGSRLVSKVKIEEILSDKLDDMWFWVKIKKGKCVSSCFLKKTYARGKWNIHISGK